MTQYDYEYEWEMIEASALSLSKDLPAISSEEQQAFKAKLGMDMV